MKNKLQTIKQTWTYKHKSLIIILSLLVALYYPVYIAPYIPSWPTATVTYYAPQATSTPPTLETEVQARTLELYEQNKAHDLEKYRHEAIKEVNEQLQGMLYNSPHIDYEAMKDKYGY
jgi:hypothetical protein